MKRTLIFFICLVGLLLVFAPSVLAQDPERFELERWEEVTEFPIGVYNATLNSHQNQYAYFAGQLVFWEKNNAGEPMRHFAVVCIFQPTTFVAIFWYCGVDGTLLIDPSRVLEIRWRESELVVQFFSRTEIQAIGETRQFFLDPPMRLVDRPEYWPQAPFSVY